ncbi:hypothetical protein TNCV_277811 [Trichonephila clavipes]|nr:hypothetical protein TNCV_277811 [Trichonephila clavipes]
MNKDVVGQLQTGRHGGKACERNFTFGLRTVKSGEIHLIQTTHVPMLIYELPASSVKCRAQPNVIREKF